MKRTLLLISLLLMCGLTGVKFAAAQFTQQGTVPAPTPLIGNQLLTAADPYAKPDRPNALNPERPYWYVANASGLSIYKLGTNELLGSIPWPATYELAQPNGTTKSVAAPSIALNNPDGTPVLNSDGTQATTPNWEPQRLLVPFPSSEDLGPEALSGADVVAFVEMAHSGYQWGTTNNIFRDRIDLNTDPELESSLMLMIVVTNPAQPEVLAGAILGHEAGQMAWDPNGGVMYVANNKPSLSLPANLASFISKITAPEAGAEAGPIYAPKTFYPLCGPEIEWSGEVKEEAKMGIPVGVPEAWICDALNGPGEGEGPFTYKFENLPLWLTPHALNAAGEGDGVLYGTPTQVGSYPFKVTVTDTPTGATASAVFTISVMPSVTEFAGGEMEIEAGVTGAFAIWATPESTCDTANGATGVPPWLEILTVPNGCVMIMNSPTLAGEYFDFVFPNLTRIDPRTGVAYPKPTGELHHVSAEVLGTYNFDALPAGATGLSGIAWHEINMIPGEPDKYVLNGEFIGVEASTGQLYKVVLPYEDSDTIEDLPPDSLEMVVPINVVSPMGLSLTKSATERFGDVVVEADGDIFVGVLNQDPNVPNAPGAVIKVSGGAVQPRIDLGVQPSFLALDSDLEPAVKPDLGGVGQKDYGYLLATGPTGVAQIATSGGAASVFNNEALGGVAVDSVATGSAFVAGPSVDVSLFSSTPRDSAPVIAAINPLEALVDPTMMKEGVPVELNIVSVGWPVPTVSVSNDLPPGLEVRSNGNGTATIYGTPTTGGIYTSTATATNGVVPDASQAFTLTVEAREAPQFMSPNTGTLMAGIANQLKIDVSGQPTPVLTWSTDSGTLPAGVTFHDNGACSPAVPAGCTGSAFLGGIPTQNGTYTLTITAANGVEPNATQTFTLIVDANAGTGTQPAITLQPVSVTVNEGELANFSAAASGNPMPTVQWELDEVGTGEAWGPIAGATATSYSIAPATAMNGYQYRAVFTNSLGTVTSAAATLTVNASSGVPVVTLQPTNAIVTLGQTATFKTAATATEKPTVQWQQSTNNGSSWSAIRGAISTSYTTPVTTNKMKGYQYRAVFTNTKGATISKVASLLFKQENGPITTGDGYIKVRMDVGSEPEGIAVNPVTHTAYILSRDVATNTKNVVVIDNDTLNSKASPKKLNLPLGAAAKAPKLIHIANDHEYLAIDSTRNLIYVPTNYAAPYTPELNQPPDENDEPTAGVLGTLTAIDGKTNSILAVYEFPEGYIPEATAVDPVNNIVYIAAKLPEAGSPSGCPIDPASGQAECEFTGGMIYAFNAANVRQGKLGSPIASIPAEEPESIVFDPVSRLLYAADESKGRAVIAHAVNSKGVPEANGITWLPIWTTRGFADSGPNPYALPCSPYEADKMTVGLNGAVYMTDDKSRVAKIVNEAVVGMTHIDLPGGDNTPLYCYGEEPVQGQNTANNIGFMKTNPDPLTGVVTENLYVVSEQNTVSVLDPATLALKSTIFVPGATELDAIAVDGSMGRVWITDEVGQSGTDTGGAVFVLHGACAKGGAVCSN